MISIPGAFALSGLVFLIISGVLGLSADSKQAKRQRHDSGLRMGAWLTFAVSGILFLSGIWGAAL